MAKSPHWSDNLDGIEQATVKATNQAFRSQETILEHLFSYRRPSSVVDIGCGPGYWLGVCLDMGVESVHGYDVTDLPAEERLFPSEFFTLADLTQPMHFERKADLAISTEVAEHIDIASAGIFIDNLTRASDMVLFSAALPYQGGVGHVNENWVEFWFEMFSKRNYRCFDLFRIPLWNDPRIHYYYRQNIILYVHQDRAHDFLDQGLREERRPLSLIHPDLYIQAVNRTWPPEERRMEEDARLYYQAVDAIRGTSPRNAQDYTYGQEKIWYDFERMKRIEEKFEKERETFRSQIQILEHERDGLLASTSWRATAPLRVLGSYLRKMTGR